jgi:hypothetical protein
MYKNNSDKSYTGWYYGAGFIDRVCAYGIMLLMKNDFDGLTGMTGFFTPFSSLTQTEIIVWNQNDAVKRRPKNKYDSMQFIKKLNFDPLKINFDITNSHMNKNFQLIRFYINNSIQTKTQIQNEMKHLPNGFKIMSLNVNNFISINLDDKKEFIMHKLMELIVSYDIDICCLQEYNTMTNIIDATKNSNYKIIQNLDHAGLVILYKSSQIISNIYFFKLPNEKFLNQNLFGLFFTTNIGGENKKICNTNLEIGKKFYDRSGSIYYAGELVKIINFNYNVRKKQLEKILNEEPDYIVGNFNFNEFDAEYDFITKKNSINYYTGLVDYTTSFAKQTDFIFSKSKYKEFLKIKYQYSNHLPILAII